ncbi:MAG: fructosamine kinase family protein [Bacteroidales bacterium]|nr:fructosamine kinase family protein [Bacteroidales bacterium]
MLPDALHLEIETVLRENTFLHHTITKFTPVGGGCINDAHVVTTDRGSFFVKYNHARRYPGMFEAEARGLEVLKNAAELSVPEVVGTGQADDRAFLILDYIDSRPQEKNFWENFGRGLARLHKHSNQHFGLEHSNYIGSLPQRNAFRESWTEFFVNERIRPQLHFSRESGKTDKDLEKKFERLFARLGEFFPAEPPALLHGDLWSGNYMTGSHGEAVIIDPAVYFGHRYMDLGMSKLFGGFAPEFYRAYHDEYPLDPNWQQGIEIANLYPLMVHVNLFGGGYLGSVNSILGGF